MNAESNELAPKERDYLLGILTERLGTQREGVYHSENREFKEEMKEEENTLRRLIEKFKVKNEPHTPGHK